MTNDTNVRIDRKDAELLKRIAKAQGKTVKSMIGSIIKFYREATTIK